MAISFTLGLAMGGETLAKYFRVYIGWNFAILGMQLVGVLYYDIESPNYYLTKFGKRFSKPEI